MHAHHEGYMYSFLFMSYNFCLYHLLHLYLATKDRFFGDKIYLDSIITPSFGVTALLATLGHYSRASQSDFGSVGHGSTILCLEDLDLGDKTQQKLCFQIVQPEFHLRGGGGGGGGGGSFSPPPPPKKKTTTTTTELPSTPLRKNPR